MTDISPTGRFIDTNARFFVQEPSGNFREINAEDVRFEGVDFGETEMRALALMGANELTLDVLTDIKTAQAEVWDRLLRPKVPVKDIGAVSNGGYDYQKHNRVRKRR